MNILEALVQVPSWQVILYNLVVYAFIASGLKLLRSFWRS